jgi:tRNA threonylcarbamoyladenosine biosynthesis protein TsaB
VSGVWVGVDTSTSLQSVAIARDGVVVDSLSSLRRAHSRGLAGSLRDALARHGLEWDDIDTYVVGVGPGSFTGLRVGVSLVKGLALAGSVPAIGVSSLVAAPASLPAGGVCAVAIDAFKHLVYAGVFETGPAAHALVDVHLSSPEAFGTRLTELAPGWVRCGDGFARYADALSDHTSVSEVPTQQPSAAGLLRFAWANGLAPVDAAMLEPRYVRRSAADEARDRRLAAEASRD